MSNASELLANLPFLIGIEFPSGVMISPVTVSPACLTFASKLMLPLGVIATEVQRPSSETTGVPAAAAAAAGTGVGAALRAALQAPEPVPLTVDHLPVNFPSLSVPSVR